MQEQYHQWTTLRTWNPNSCSKMWRPSGLTLRRMPFGKDTLRILLRRFCSKEGPHYCFMQSARNMTINLIHEFGNPLGVPSRAVLRSLAGLMSREEVLVWGFLWVRKVWFAFAQRTFAPETFGKRPKASCFEKPMRSVPEIWGRMYGVLPRSAEGTRNGMRNRIPVQPRKARSN